MKITLLALLLTIALGTTFATTTDQLMLSNLAGTITATITDNGACAGVGGGCTSLSGDTNGANGSINVSGTITLGAGTWTVSVAGGTSNSPTLTPYGLDIFSLTAFCSGSCTGSASELDIYFSDKNFTAVTTGFSTFYSASDTGAASTTETAYMSNTNVDFAKTTPVGSVGPILGLGGSGSSSVSAPAGPAAYSLTLEDALISGAGGATFSVDGNITAVPEPGAVILFGTALVFCASKLRRRRAS